MPHDVITQLLRVLAIETKQEKAIINADATDVALSGLEAFSFDYIVKWPLSLIINRFRDFTWVWITAPCAAFIGVKCNTILAECNLCYCLHLQKSAHKVPDVVPTHVLL